MDFSSTICAKFSQDILSGGAVRFELLSRIIGLIAERYVEEHYSEIVAKLDQNAIANLAVADAGKKIAEEIRTRPVVYREKGDTYNKRSIF